MAIFGGMGQFYGPVIGAAIFAYLEEFLITKFPVLLYVDIRHYISSRYIIPAGWPGGSGTKVAERRLSRATCESLKVTE